MFIDNLIIKVVKLPIADLVILTILINNNFSCKNLLIKHNLCVDFDS